MVVWVQFPAFPVHFYHQEILFSLGNMIGRAIKLDFHTQHQQRVKFARMAVELDLSKPLVSRIRLDGKWQYIEYENLPKVCFECGKVGHTAATCPSLQEAMLSITVGAIANSPEKSSEASPEDKAGFGPWMQVTRRSRRENRANEKGNIDVNHGDLVNGAKVEKGKSIPKNLESVSGNKGGNRESQVHRVENPKQGKLEKGKASVGTHPKGKEKFGKPTVEVATCGRGVLGPIPASPKILFSGPNKAGPDQGSRRERGAALLDIKNGPSPNKERTDSQSGAGPSSSGPPPILTVNGPNNTSIEIVNITPYENQHTGERGADTPSTAIRTKNQKSSKKRKTKSPRKTPVPISAKALQVWTPVKDKKSKARTRLASLTLQEIEAWTGAAKANATESLPFQAPTMERRETSSLPLESADST
ncbi:unnamed protein product [Linum tenue]|uniref:CCHC-type domain-containing protein n=1 Tax=Linum tenue TaxID=586396 RepID=A0AAV0RWY0_9ROSI|nr:unnamed protein product [Linum tenue]